LLHLLVLERV